MAYINPCNLSLNPSNTGAECDGAMKATAMIIMGPKNAVITAADLLDFTAKVQTMIHASPATRWFPIFGNAAPIRQITESNEADVIETFEDGAQKFVRYGVYNRTFLTDKGGMALARHLMAMREDYGFIEVDITGQVALMTNADGTFGFFPTNLAKAPAPTLANLKTVYKNAFMLSFSPSSYIAKGKVLSPDASEDLLSARGLYDVEVLEGDGTHSITKLYVKVKTKDGETDLVDTLGAPLAAVSNFVLTNENGTTNTPSAAAIVGGEIEFTGTFATGTDITVGMAAPSVLKAAGIEGYDGVTEAVIAIP